MYNKKCTCYIFILIFLPTFLDGLQRKVETEKLSNNLISDNVELPKEWKNQDWGKAERLLQKSNGRNDTVSSRSLSPSSTQQSQENLCLTPNCVKSAASILESIDQNVNPCDDFYSYVCGSWIDKAIIPQGHEGHSVMGEIAEQNKYQIHKALFTPVNNNDSSDESRTHRFYMSCLDEEMTEFAWYEPLFDVFFNQLKMPSTAFVRMDEENILKPQKLIEDLMVKFLLDTNIYGIDVDRNPKNADKETLIQLYQPNLIFSPGDYNLSSTNTQAALQSYGEYVTGVAAELRNYLVQTSNVQVQSDLDLVEKIAKIVAIEAELGSILYQSKSLEDETITVTLEELENLMNEEALPMHINIVQSIKNTIKRLINHDLTKKTKVLVPHLNYFIKLNKILNQFDPEDISNFLLFQKLLEYSMYTNRVMKELNMKFKLKVKKTLDSSIRWMYCVDRATFYFGARVSEIYAAKYHGEQTKVASESLIGNLRSSFSTLINEAQWMDEGTRKLAIEKLAAIKARDGFSQNLSRMDVAQVYEGLDGIKSDSFLQNVFNLQEFWSKKEISRALKEPTFMDDINKLGFDTSLVNAMYVPPENSIWIPLGIQRPPFYQYDSIQALNYGALGLVLGHEMTHGFDNMGALYDAHGNFKNWWTNATRKEFQNKQKCFIEEYGNYNFPILDLLGEDYHGPKNVSGTRTLGENIADNGGIREAYLAYQKYVKSHGKEPQLPGLPNFTSEQLFFIGYGRGWCETKTIQALVRQLLVDPHPPAIVRVHNVLRNFEEFQNAFQCKNSDSMVAKPRCRIW